MLLLGLVGGVVYYFKGKITQESPRVIVIPPIAPVKSEDHYPVTVAVNPNQKPLPILDQSDPSFEEELSTLFDPLEIQDIFDFKNIIRRLVITVENASEATWSQDFLPYRPVHGRFRVIKNGNVVTLDSKKLKRYSPYLHFAEEVDLKRVVGIYVHFYPLFQSAYIEVGGSGEFNDKLVHVVDLLLKTPTPKDTVQLLEFNSSYKFLDPELEALSVGQKMLIRIGSDSEKIMKDRLREFRGYLTKLSH